MTIAQEHTFPSCSFDYLVVKNDNNCWLDVYAHFDSSRYTKSATQTDAMGVVNAQKDLPVFQSEYEKLLAEDVQLYLQTTMDESNLHELNKQEMIAYTWRIIAFLKRIGNEDLLLSKATETPLFSQEISISNENICFKQQVTVIFKKGEKSETFFTPMPLMSDHSFEQFAGAFEKTFDARYKIAIADNTSELWVVDTSRKEGIYDVKDLLYYFAPQPLSTLLIDRKDVSLYEYASGISFPPVSSQLRQFASVSIDEWVMQFITAVQMMRSSAYAAPLKALDLSAAQKLDVLSGSITDAVTGGLVKLLDADQNGGNLAKAKESFHQIVLKDLTNIYAADSVIVQQVSMIQFADLAQYPAPLLFVLPDPVKETKPFPSKISNTTPALSQHFGFNAHPVDLQEVKEWSYDFSYVAPKTVSEEILIGINMKPSSNRLIHSEPGGPDLFDRLAQFVTVWPALSADLQKFLLTDPDKEKAIVVLSVFMDLATSVAAYWPLWYNRPKLLHGSETQYNYVISEKKYDGKNAAWNIPEGVLQFNIVRNKEDDRTLTPFVEGYETVQAQGSEDIFFFFNSKEESWMPFNERRERTIELKDLNILTTQSIQMGISILGNRNLKPGMVTNPLFVYETPVQKLSELFVPLISNDAEWNIASGRSPLVVHLKKLFETIFNEIAKGSIPISLICGYRYQLNESVDITTALPVFAIPQYVLEIPSDYNDQTSGSFVNELTQTIQQWQKVRQPSGLNAAYVFDLTAFGDQEKPSPVLQYSNLYLKVADISD